MFDKGALDAFMGEEGVGATQAVGPVSPLATARLSLRAAVAAGAAGATPLDPHTSAADFRPCVCCWQGRALLSEVGRVTSPSGGRYMCVSLLQVRNRHSTTLPLRPVLSATRAPHSLEVGKLKQVSSASSSESHQLSRSCPFLPGASAGRNPLLPQLGLAGEPPCSLAITTSLSALLYALLSSVLRSHPLETYPEPPADPPPPDPPRTQVDIMQVPPSMDMLMSPLQPFLVVCQALPEALVGAASSAPVPKPVKCHFQAAGNNKVVNFQQVCLAQASPNGHLALRCAVSGKGKES